MVLLIEDHADTREMYSIVLSACGFAVLQASDAAQGLAVAAKLRPNVVVTDLMMSGPVHAVAVCEHFQQLGVPVIVLTGVSPGHLRDDIETAGCNELYMKPFDPYMLLRAIERHIQPISN